MDESNVEVKDRGWGLTIVIPLTIIGYSLQIVLQILNYVTNGSLLPTISNGLALFSFISSFLFIAFLVAAWQWKKWGCFGYIVLGPIGSLVYILLNGFQWFNVSTSAISALFAFAVYKSKEKYFE